MVVSGLIGAVLEGGIGKEGYAERTVGFFLNIMAVLGVFSTDIKE